MQPNTSHKTSLLQAVTATRRGVSIFVVSTPKRGATLRASIGWEVGRGSCNLCARHSARKSVNISMVSRGPPALSGWNWTPHTFLPDSAEDLMPSTEESLQLMKKGSQPAGKGSWSFNAYWWFWLGETVSERTLARKDRMETYLVT